MNITPTHNDDRFSPSTRVHARWRTATLVLLSMLTGLLVGGMGSGSKSSVVGVAALDGKIYRVHEDGSITYVKVDDYFKTANGAFS